MFDERKNIATEMGQRFVCPKCRGNGADVQSLAMTGTGLSRLLDFQRHRYMFVSCLACGYTEIYNSRVIDASRGRGMDVLDLLFGN